MEIRVILHLALIMLSLLVGGGAVHVCHQTAAAPGCACGACPCDSPDCCCRAGASKAGAPKCCK
jgi:hypothetical protein